MKWDFSGCKNTWMLICSVMGTVAVLDGCLLTWRKALTTQYLWMIQTSIKPSRPISIILTYLPVELVWACVCVCVWLLRFLCWSSGTVKSLYEKQETVRMVMQRNRSLGRRPEKQKESQTAEAEKCVCRALNCFCMHSHGNALQVTRVM